MNIIANNVASKLFVAFVAAAMLFTLATPAKAATTEELQAQIAALMAQISALQGGSSTPAAQAGACTFTKALTIGSAGDDVKCLQDYLASTGHFKNAGGSTGTFGPITAAAVSAWQTANGVSPAAGYFGPVSQAKYNALMAMTDDSDDSDDTDSTDDSDDSSDDEDDSSSDLSGEADLDTTDLTDGDDTDVEEGGSGDVAEFKVEFTEGDARITRIDLDFGVTGTEEDAWDTFEEVSLLIDGEEVATKATDDKDAWLDEDAMTLRFGGLDIVAMEDEEVTMVIKVTTQGSIDDLPATWNVDVTSLRFLDADDISSTETITEDSVDFDVEEAGGDDELIIKSASSDLDATTISVEDDVKSGWEPVFSFDLDTDDSVNDVEVTDLRVDLLTTEDGTTATSSALLISDVRLMLDGEEIGDGTNRHGVGSASTTFDFDDEELVIAAGDRVTLEVQVKFLALPSALEGATVQGSTSETGLAAESADDLSASQISGSAQGDEHTLRTAGIDISEFEGALTVTTNDTADNSYGEFVMEFDVTAIGDDEMYIPLTAAAMDAAGSTTKGAVYKVTDANGNLVASSTADTLSATLVVVSGGDTDTTGYVRLDSDETATLKLTVTFNPGSTAGQYGASLQSVGFNDTEAAADERVTLLPVSSYDVDPKNISS